VFELLSHLKRFLNAGIEHLSLLKNGLLSTASAHSISHMLYRGAHKAKYITCCKKASMQMSFVSVSHLHCCITYAQPVHHRRLLAAATAAARRQ
jgi:hypothetical protein